MSEIQIGQAINTSLGDTIVIEKNGKDAILYRKGEIENQYIYAHNIELDESKNKYVWSAGEYYPSLSDCMVNVIANQKESFYELIDTAHKLHHSNYIKGIVRAETEVDDENFLESIYEKYLDSEGIDDIFGDDFKQLLTNEAVEFADEINNVIKALKDYYKREFGEIAIDESMNYSSVEIAHTTTPDGKWNIDYSIDLNDLKWHQMVDGAIVDKGTFRDYEEIAEVLNSSSFEDFVRIDEDKLLKEMNLTIDYDGNFKRANLVAIKLEQEFEAYKNDLKNEDVEYIIDRSFETYYKDNIVIAARNIQFSEEDEEVLLNKENLLDELYDDWMGYDFDEMEGYLNSVVDSRDKIMQHHMNKYIDKNKEAGYEPEL